MKKIIVLSLVLIALKGRSQNLNDSLSNVNFELDDSTAARLAELAMSKSLDLKILDKQTEMNLYDLQKAKGNYLNNFTASFNLNEINLKPRAEQGNVFFPRYNFNLSLPLGTFITKPKDVKIAKARYESSQAARDLEASNLKGQIKTAYETYQMNTYLLTLQETVLQDEFVLMNQVQQKFKDGQVSLEVFTNASKRYNVELVKRVNLLKDVNASKYALETLLGMDLASAYKAIHSRPGRNLKTENQKR